MKLSMGEQPLGVIPASGFFVERPVKLRASGFVNSAVRRKILEHYLGLNWHHVYALINLHCVSITISISSQQSFSNCVKFQERQKIGKKFSDSIGC